MRRYHMMDAKGMDFGPRFSESEFLFAILLGVILGTGLGICAMGLANDVRQSNAAAHCAKIASPGFAGYASEQSGTPVCVIVPNGAPGWQLPKTFVVPVKP